MTAEPLPDWFMPPPGGWTADDLDKLPPGAPRMELIDGALIVMSPQTLFHSRVLRRLTNALEDLAPPELRADEEMTIILGKRQRPEPDIVVYKKRENSEDDWHEETSIPPEDVALVVEVVSTESAYRDREVKPKKYAEAGIPHFWRVDKEERAIAVHVYEFDVTTKSYAPISVYRERLKIDRPFPIDIDVQALVD